MQGVSYVGMRDVGKLFGSTKALSRLTFNVERGEIFGFLGPSGAGKTTTIKLLTGQLKADTGSVYCLGREMGAIRSSMYDRIGILSDTNGFYERLTVQENLEVFAGIRGMKKHEIDAVLENVGLIESRKKKAKQLSRGMTQRLMLACAVLHKPELLFLDEPTAALDPGTSLRIHKLLLNLNQNGTTIFLTTHNMEEADKLCHRVAFLNNGRMVACDSPASLKLAYASDEIAILTKNGKTYKAGKSKAGLLNLARMIEDNDEPLTVHSTEPTLEDVFLTLTGRDLS